MAVSRASAAALAVMTMAGCAARGIPAHVQDRLRAADALVADGCFTCLRDAIGIYDEVAAGRRVPPDLSQRRFEAEILLTLRAKEIGMPADPWLDRARADVASLPDATAGVALELADLVPGETSGVGSGTGDGGRFRHEVLDDIAAWRTRVAQAALGTPLKQYLDLTLACRDRTARDAVLASEAAAPGSAIRYRLATCGPAPDADVGRLLADDPRWREAAWFEGRRLLAQTGDVPAAVTHFAEAAEAFPQSAVMLMSLAGAQRAVGELDAALATYDAVLRLAPDHRNALLGKVLCLTYLERPKEAITASTRLIDLGTYLLADAYYWRAWNGYHLQALDSAWSDVTEALALQTSTNVHTLAGLIAYARHDADTALTHFDTAWSLDSRNCDAAFYKGVVLSERRTWSGTAQAFDAAMRCFTGAAARARAALETLQASTAPAAFKTRQGATHMQEIATSERQAAVSAYNAAQAFVHLGQTDLALSHLDHATHPAIQEKADALRRRLTGEPMGAREPPSTGSHPRRISGV